MFYDGFKAYCKIKTGLDLLTMDLQKVDLLKMDMPISVQCTDTGIFKRHFADNNSPVAGCAHQSDHCKAGGGGGGGDSALRFNPISKSNYT